jgi:ABC-type transport system involved in multi-copper enzyme maturation permease subunit
MPGVWTIAKKEFTDHVSDGTLLLCFGTLMFTMIVSAYTQVYNIRLQIFWGLEAGNMPQKDANAFIFPELITAVIITQIITVGVLLAIVLSFNSINKERTEGSLKVLLSYPIYRDKIIIGKLLAGSAIIALAMLASMTTAFSLIIYYLNLPITLELIAKITLVTAMATILLLFFMGIGTVVSILLNDALTIIVLMLLIATILNSETIAMIVSVTANFFSRIGAGFVDPKSLLYLGSYFPGARVIGSQSSYWPSIIANYVKYSPVESFRLFSEKIFAVEWTSGTGQILRQPIEIFLMENFDLIAIQILSVIMAFILCYILFVKKDEM